MYICKFGGSSLSTYDNILKVVDIIISKKCKLIVVFSAIGKTTDKLIQLGKKAENKDDTYTELINELKLELYQIVEKLSKNHCLLFIYMRVQDHQQEEV